MMEMRRACEEEDEEVMSDVFEDEEEEEEEGGMIQGAFPPSVEMMVEKDLLVSDLSEELNRCRAAAILPLPIYTRWRRFHAFSLASHPPKEIPHKLNWGGKSCAMLPSPTLLATR